MTFAEIMLLTGAIALGVMVGGIGVVGYIIGHFRTDDTHAGKVSNTCVFMAIGLIATAFLGGYLAMKTGITW